MCIFCDIVDKKIPSYTLYEDDSVIAFLDVNPKSNGHTLIVPKNHTLDIDTIDMDTLNHIIEVSKIIKKKLEDRLNINGITYLQNNGAPQEVKHFHLHLIPSYDNEELVDVEKIYEKLK